MNNKQYNNVSNRQKMSRDDKVKRDFTGTDIRDSIPMPLYNLIAAFSNAITKTNEEKGE